MQDYDFIKTIVTKAARDAEDYARKSLPELGITPDELTITAITSFLIGRLPGAIINPERYGYETKK